MAMKYHGCQSYYKEERDADLLSAYRKAMDECEQIILPDIYKKVVNMPAKRFWISEERATIVISEMMRGNALKGMNNNKKAMFKEIYRRVVKIRRIKPDSPLNQIVSEVIHQPAPSFYLSPGTARIMIFYAKKRWLKEKQRKLRHLFM